MFKRPKKFHPNQPNLSEILKDMETFHLKNPDRSKSFESCKQSSINHEDKPEFWSVFEMFIYDGENLKQLKTQINGFKLHLESSKLEIDTVAKDIRCNIDQYLDDTRKAVTKKEE